jgi:hypothetical protein
MPPHKPEPKGKPVCISCFVDANHAGNVVTPQLHTGILIYLSKCGSNLVLEATEYGRVVEL